MLSRQSKVTPRTCKLFVLPLLTLLFPLGVFLVFLKQIPAEEIQLASTDARLLQPVSTFWCAAQEITSGHPFYAYKVPKEPSFLKESTHQHNLAFRFNLLHGKHYLLRYHLLPGSTLELAGCTNREPAPFEVFYGEEAWTECFRTLTLNRKDDSSEESLSLSDSHENFPELPGLGNGVSHTEYVHQRSVRETVGRQNRKVNCTNSILSGQLDLSLMDEEPSPACPIKDYPFSVTAVQDGKYYLLVRTDGLNYPGGVLLHVRLNRTVYELPEDVLFCRSPSTCTIPLTFGSKERVVVFVSVEPDAGAALFPVVSKCQPRAAFYLVVFLLLPVLFALALLYAVRYQQQKRKASASNDFHETLNTVVQDNSCDSREQEEVHKRENTLSEPPSYSEVVRERPAYNSSPPPSYEELLRQPLVSVHRL